MSNTNYDSALLAIPFYKAHPYMLPFVGGNYESPSHKKLLLVGESHYMPLGSTVHHDSLAWYGSPVLSQEESDWCNTRGTREWKSGRFSKEIARCLDLVLPSVANSWDQVAFFNYFLRPADECKNIEDLWNSQGGKDDDCEQAVKNFVQVVDVLKPDLIVLLSSRVCKQVEGLDFPKYFDGNLWDWTRAHGVCDYIYTNHPSRPRWNMPMPNYEKSRGLTSRDFFCEWLKQNWVL